MAARPATGEGREWPVELVGGPKDGNQFVVRTLTRTPPPDIVVPLTIDETTGPLRKVGVYRARSYLFGGTPDMTRLKYDWAGERTS